MKTDLLKTLFTYALFVLGGTLGAFSDAALNQWARSSRVSWLLAGYGLWFLVATVLALLLKLNYFSFGGSIAVFTLSNVVVATLIDHFLYGSPLSRYHLAGIVCAVLAILFFEFGRTQAAG
jgi:multidrug transporter EmrE-like cation transporter